MGLDINKYSYSYSVLQQLRQLYLNYEGINIPICDFYEQFEITTKRKLKIGMVNYFVILAI